MTLGAPEPLLGPLARRDASQETKQLARCPTTSAVVGLRLVTEVLCEDGLVDDVAADAPVENPPDVPDVPDDPDVSDEDVTEPEFGPAGFERWRRETALGAVGTGIARGLQNVFGTQQDQIVMVAPVPGDPPDPDRLQVILDPDDPTKSIVVVPLQAADAADSADCRPTPTTSPADHSRATPSPAKGLTSHRHRT